MQENKNSTIQWPTILIVAVLSLVILTFSYWNVIAVQGDIIKQAEAAFMREQIHTMEASLREIGEECHSLNKAVASDPEVEKSIIKANRQDLKELSLPAYSKLQGKHALTNLQLISPQGLMLASVKTPMEKGEDVSYRRLILASLQDKQSSVAFETCDEGINLVSTAPLFTKDKFIGLSELDMSLVQALEHKLDKKVTANYAIFKLDGIHSHLVWGEKANQMVLNTNDIEKIHHGGTYYRPTLDKKTMLLVIPLKDIDGVSIGYIQGEISRQMFVDARTNNLIFLAIVTLLILIASFFMVSHEGIYFTQSKHGAVNLADSGKISRVSIRVKSVQKDNSKIKSDESLM